MRRVARLLAVATVVASLSGCAAAPSFDVSVRRFVDGPQPLEVSSGFTEPANLIARNQSELDALWSTIYLNQATPPPALRVDFTRQLVVGRAMGPRPTGGFSVVITGLLREGGQYVVQVRETSPGPDCVVTLAQTSPVDLALIARHDDPIRFAISSTTVNCPAGGAR